MDAPQNAGSMVLLTRLAKVVYRRSSEDLLGMRLRRYVTLSYLRDQGRVPQQQMCEMLTIDANNLVLLLNELEAAGHVRRWRDPEDRRRHIVELTDAGRNALDRAERAQESIEEDVLASLTAAERATLRDLLARALACASAPASEPAGAADAARSVGGLSGGGLNGGPRGGTGGRAGAAPAAASAPAADDADGSETGDGPTDALPDALTPGRA